jgi:hypothetical protein
LTLHRKSAVLTFWEELMNHSEILREFGIIYDPKINFSQLGGLETFLVFLKKGKFLERFSHQFGYYRARTMMQIILGIIVGARSMNDIGKIGKDALIRRFLPDVVEEAQLGRDVKSFTREMIEALHDFIVSISILDFTKKVTHDEDLIFDIDSTSVKKYGHQEGVEHGYVGKEEPEKCYQYLFVRLHNRNTFLYGTIRSGSTHSQNDFCGYLKRFLPLTEKRWKVAWRGDSAYFNEEAFDLFTKHDATFFIKAPMIESRRNLANISPDLIWSPTKGGMSYACRETLTAQGTRYREVFKRTQGKTFGQMSLGELAGFEYDCLSTNDLLIEPQKAFEFYNGRANIENNIRELKNDYQLGKIITEDFDANDVITQLTLLAYLLMAHFKHEVLPDNMRRMTLSSLRNQLFNIPGRLLYFARRYYTRIQNIFLGEEIYAKIMMALRNLRSWVLEPPILETAAA